MRKLSICLIIGMGLVVTGCNTPSFDVLLSEGIAATEAITTVLEASGKISPTTSNGINWAATSAAMLVDCADAKTGVLGKVGSCVTEAQTLLTSQPFTSDPKITSNVSVVLQLAAAFISAFNVAPSTATLPQSLAFSYATYVPSVSGIDSATFLTALKVGGMAVRHSKMKAKKVAKQRARAEALKERLAELKAKIKAEKGQK